ncbi:precorrin-3B C(17)-methyltransferase [Paracoccus sp. (in: a-proteobacteria)]|uniref:precorrin-3B C(17)-methyltransferase n=1 Tax=Paracoccus sp. TaxID=267 RepID=UPI002AFFB5EA|nr:precorrin-3B C(17)-methyltransferase [Paracoccus sp. (in: a-proteobacteria)]
MSGTHDTSTPPTIGSLTIIGLGPGDARYLTPAAQAALDEATDLIGYFPYVARVPERPGLRRHGSDNRVELDRSRHALELAAGGAKVAVVSGGDPGVFAMAAAVFEALENGPVHWRTLNIVVEPGITAMLAAAARVGAPLGGDFCAMSLSDNLKPWALVAKRLTAALEADFAIALYNPISKARPHQLDLAFDIARTIRAPQTPVLLARAVGRPDESLRIVALENMRGEMADMSTIVIIGASTTRMIPRADGDTYLYTPRSHAGLEGADT